MYFSHPVDRMQDKMKCITFDSHNGMLKIDVHMCNRMEQNIRNNKANNYFLENDNEQIVLLKKLIILSFIYGKTNSNLNKYMTCSRKASREVKQNLLNEIYELEVKESDYTLLDLLVPYRYLIYEHVKDLKVILKKNKITTKIEAKGTSCFHVIETAFYDGK